MRGKRFNIRKYGCWQSALAAAEATNPDVIFWTWSSGSGELSYGRVKRVGDRFRLIRNLWSPNSTSVYYNTRREAFALLADELAKSGYGDPLGTFVLPIRKKETH